jgi:MFS family permease
MSNKLEGHAARRSAAAEVACMLIGSTIVTPLYALYREEFGFSEVTLTLIYAAYALGNLCALFLLGRLSDQIGRRPTALPAVGIAIVAMLVFLFASGTAWLFVARALTGLAIGLALGASAAWIADLTKHDKASRASAIMTGASFVGLAIGALLAGVLAQYAPAPLRLSFIVYLVLLVTIGFFISRTRETVRDRVDSFEETSLAPRIGVPRDIRARFVSPATTAFATFALAGFYVALSPSLISREMEITNVAVGGAIVCELFVIAALTVAATVGVKARTGMLAGAALLIPSAALLVAAQAMQSLTVLIAGTTLTGVAVALGYRGSLEVINDIAPEDKRAEVVSSYQIVCFIGNGLPVVGVGVIASMWTPMIATVSLAALLSALAIVALATEMRGKQT